MAWSMTRDSAPVRLLMFPALFTFLGGGNRAQPSHRGSHSCGYRCREHVAICALTFRSRGKYKT